MAITILTRTPATIKIKEKAMEEGRDTMEVTKEPKEDHAVPAIDVDHEITKLQAARRSIIKIRRDISVLPA